MIKTQLSDLFHVSTLSQAKKSRRVSDFSKIDMV